MEDLILYDERILKGIKFLMSVDTCTRFVHTRISIEEDIFTLYFLSYDRYKGTLYLNDEDVTYLKDYLNYD